MHSQTITGSMESLFALQRVWNFHGDVEAEHCEPVGIPRVVKQWGASTIKCLIFLHGTGPQISSNEA